MGFKDERKFGYYCKFSDKEGKEYVILDSDSQSDIESFFGETMDQAFLDAASIGLKVGLRYIRYKSKNVVTTVWLSTGHKCYLERQRQDYGFPI